MMLWLTSRAALPVLKTVSLLSNVSGRQLHDLAVEIDALGTEPVQRAVAAEITHRIERYLAGLELIAAIRSTVIAPRGRWCGNMARRDCSIMAATRQPGRCWSCPR
jgi:hypothetical protein